MATYHVNTKNEWRKFNVSLFKLYMTNTDSYLFYNVRLDSTVNIRPILRQDDYGRDVVQAWQLEGTIIIAENDFTNRKTLMDDLQNYAVTSVGFKLWQSRQDYSYEILDRSVPETTAEKWSVTWELIDGGQLQFNVRGRLHKSIISNSLFFEKT